MSVKMFHLATGERVIAKAQEVVEVVAKEEGDESESPKKVLGYMFEQPHVVIYENDKIVASEEDGVTLDISMTPWQLLSKNVKIPVSTALVWAIVDPIDSVVDMYIKRVFPEDSVELNEETTDE